MMLDPARPASSRPGRCADCGQVGSQGRAWRLAHRLSGSCWRRRQAIHRWLWEEAPRSREEALLKIRIHMRALGGLWVDDLTDDQLEAGIRDLARVGCSAAEAADRMRAILAGSGRSAASLAGDAPG